MKPKDDLGGQPLAPGPVPAAARQAALAYAARGWSVIPIEPRGKRPLVPWLVFQHRVAAPGLVGAPRAQGVRDRVGFGPAAEGEEAVSNKWAMSLSLAAWAVAGSAAAAEVKVLTAGAFKPVLMALAPVFEQRTGHKLAVDNDTAGALARRIGGGEAFDLVVLTPAALEQLAQSGRVAAGSVQPLARVAIGVAVKQGAPAPDISSVAAFQRALLAARAVATIDPAAGGSSGIYLWQWFEKAGIAAQLRPKAVLVPGGLVAQRVVSGEADLAVHQISEILAVPGATLVGPIPAEIQNHTVYAGGVSATARDAGAARDLLELLAGAQARAVLAAKGMEAP